MDHFTSGRSNGDDTVVRSASTLCKEPDEEIASFRRLQKMTGKLFLQLITKLMEVKQTNVAEDFKLFSLFDNNGGLVSYLDVFETQFTQNLIKRVLAKLNELSTTSIGDSKVKERLVRLLKIGGC